MNEVSRETAAADIAAAVFSDRLPLAERYAQWLAGPAVERGLLGPRETGRLWQRHILNCAVLSELIATDADVIDVGSGAGLPGLVLAIARPDLWVTLAEPMERRTVFLDEAVNELGLTNVEVLRARAEDIRPMGKADLVVSRAVAPLGKLTAWCLPLTRNGGTVLAIKGASAAEELRKYRRELWRLGARDAEVLTCGDSILDVATTVVRMRREF